MTRHLLVLGARSDIAQACARRFAREGYALQLAARNASTLDATAQDLRLRHDVDVTLHEFDVLDAAKFESFLEALPHSPDVVICAVGAMGDQDESQRDPAAAATVMRSNFEGPALILGLLANQFETRNHGSIVGISSVAGERGRASNYVYGAAKAGFTAFLSGLRNRLSRTNVQIMSVKPGFVATQMTKGMDLNPRLTAKPDEVAEAIWKGVAKKRNTLYVKPVWALVMMIIRALPETIFKKTRL